MNNVRTGVRSVWKLSWTFLGVKLQQFCSETVILQLRFLHMEKQAFFSRIMLAKACMILYLQCFGHYLSFKNFYFFP